MTLLMWKENRNANRSPPGSPNASRGRRVNGPMRMPGNMVRTGTGIAFRSASAMKAVAAQTSSTPRAFSAHHAGTASSSQYQ